MAGRVYRGFSTTSENATKNGHIYDRDVIIENVKTLLNTRKGEYPMQLDVGNIAFDFIHNPELTDVDISDIEEDLAELLETDPRVQDVNVILQKRDEVSYFALITAIVVPTNEEINLEIDLNN